MSSTADSAPRGRTLRLLAAIALVLGALLTFGTNAGASHADIFELEGNVVDDPEGSPFDWTSFFDLDGDLVPELPDATRPGFVDSAFDDDYAFPDPSTFTSGSKDTLDISAWSCSNSNNLGGKFDILNAYSTIYKNAAGDLYLFFGIERAATEGDGNMGLWFLKDGSVDCEQLGKGKAPSFTGTHTDGDVFVVAAFSNGGTQADVTAYEWDGGSDGSLNLSPIATGGLCTAGTHDANSTACGVVNTAELDTPWESPDKNGGDLDVNAFYEGYVKIPAANVSGCFATFIANTRSSTSPTATIMDFSRGSFPQCQAGTELLLESYKVNTASAVTSGVNNPSITVYKDDTLVLTFAEENKGNFTLEKPTIGRYVVIPNSTQSTACALSDVLKTSGDTTKNVGDTNDDGKLGAGEKWRYSCTITVGDTTPTTFSAFGHGIDNKSSATVLDVTWCATVDSVLVEDTVNNPRLAPADAVKCDQRERTVVSLTILAPSTEMTASASLDVIFYEKNNGNAALTKPGDGDFVRQLSATCTTFGQVLKTTGDTTKNVGDTGTDVADNGILDPGETWQWKCTKTVAATTSSDTTMTAIGHGITSTFDVTVCSSGAAVQAAKLGDNSTTATPLCNPAERRAVTLKIE